ncbi:unnamed protein product [Nippostrongylus brasiliensis]|uniref:Endo/exonuclease/phosphatase domain-containing protein n=1 Tax=Nippostrongylus brasiliensis TaxID=27835 RepID=A0A0N4YCZ7_NIPBR|nr:unnamed protein product [Nippostrongylus brasiliensis]
MLLLAILFMTHLHALPIRLDPTVPVSIYSLQLVIVGGEVRSSTLVPLGTPQLVWGELIADYRVPATGPGVRPADGETRHVIWLDDAKCNCECYGVRGNRRPLTEPGKTTSRAKQASPKVYIVKTRVATLNVGTLTGRSSELAAALEHRRIDLCALQETRWSGSKSRYIGRDFKVLYFGSLKITNGVGIAVSERFRDSISEVKRFSDRLMKIMVITENGRLHFFTAYAPQTGCSEQVKEEFWTLLHEKTAEIPPEEMIVVAGDLYGHVGKSKDGYKCHGGFGYGARNEDGERILEYACSHDLVITNTTFRKRPSHLISFYSGNGRSQIDYVLVRRRDAKLVSDAKVVPYETVASQHRPLICTMQFTPPKQKRVERCGQEHIKWWRLKEKEAEVIGGIRLLPIVDVDNT